MGKLLLICIGVTIGVLIAFLILGDMPPPYCVLMNSEKHGIDMPYPPSEE